MRSSWGPGCGRSRRTITRVLSGSPASEVVDSSPVISATAAPSRGSPSASTAAVQIRSPSAVMAARSAGGDRPANRELQVQRLLALLTQVGQEGAGAAGGVGADQDRPAV